MRGKVTCRMPGGGFLFAAGAESPMQEVKADKYRAVIALLLEMGEGFQTRCEWRMIVNAKRRLLLELADCAAASAYTERDRTR